MSQVERSFASVEKAEAIIQRWRLGESPVVWDSSDDDFRAYMNAVSTLQSVVSKTTADNLTSQARALHEAAKRILAYVSPKLEEGLLHILLAHNNPVPREKAWDAYKAEGGDGGRAVRVLEAHLPESERGICFIPEAVLWRLHLIVRAMLRNQQGPRCCRLIKNARRGALLESLRSLAQGRFEGKDVPSLPWEELEKRVAEWRVFVKVAVRVLLASERRLCERVLNVPELSEFCFAATCLGAEHMLFDFVEAFASGKKSPERIFCLLDAYETLSELEMDFAVVFEGSGPCKSLRKELSVVMSRVGVAVRGVLTELERNIEKEPSKPPQDGKVHGLTNYVVNYLNLLFEYHETLRKLYTQTTSVVVPVPKLLRQTREGGEEEEEDEAEFVEEEVVEEEDEAARQEFYGEPLPQYQEAYTLVARKLQSLEMSLEHKAKSGYKEPEKQHFFLLNNIHYIGRKVKETDLRRLLGDDWIRDAAERVQHHASEYLRHTWNKLTALLNEEPQSTFRLRNANKDKLQRFCAAFEEVCRVQRTWMVSPGVLHDELQQAVKYRVMPVYTDFYDRHAASVISARNPSKYVKHPSILNEMINDLFEGKSATAS